MATEDGWQDCGKIKGDDGKNGQNGKNAVHYELRDNGSLADITIEDDKIKLTASLSYDLYRVDGTTETKVTGTVTNDLDGGLLLYSDAHYVKTITKEYTNIDSLPASVITTAKVNNTVVATAVCKVSMSKTAYWNVDAKLGRVTSMATDNQNNIALLQLAAERISAKVGSMAELLGGVGRQQGQASRHRQRGQLQDRGQSDGDVSRYKADAEDAAPLPAEAHVLLRGEG